MMIDECEKLLRQVDERVTRIEARFETDCTLDRILASELQTLCIKGRHSCRGRFANVGEKLSRLQEAAEKLAKPNAEPSGISDLRRWLSAAEIALSIHGAFIPRSPA